MKLGATQDTSWVAGTDASMWRSRHARPLCRGWRSQRGRTDTRRSRGLAALMFIGWRLGQSAAAVEPRVFVCRAGFASRGTAVARDASATCSRPCPRPKKSWVALLVEISRSPAAWALPAGRAVDPLQEERGRGAFHAGKPLRAEEGGAEVPPQGGFDQERADVDQDDMQRGPVTINVWPQQLLGRELIDLCPRQDEQPLQQRAARCIALEQRAA